MKRILFSFISMSLLFMSPQASAELNVFTCEPEWASLVNEIGGERISSYSATTAYQDPHHIEARPGLIARLRRADLLICSGAELEAGWLPLLQRQAANPDILSGKSGYFEASAMVELIDVLDEVDRSMGDVHASGNPHVHLDPERMLVIAEALKERLVNLDPQGSGIYEFRFNDFKQRWKSAMQQWKDSAKALKGQRVVVHHRDWVYLFDWLEVEIAGALEPKPGLPASARHLVTLQQTLDVKPALMIVHTNYQNSRAANRLSEMTKIPVVELPYTVGADQVNDLFDLYETIIDKMTGVLQ